MKAPWNEAEERLLIAAAQKDPGRFADLYEVHFDHVYAFIAHRVGNRDAAQDLTADVFHRALANIRKFEARGVPFKAWLYQIASNALADKWKSAARESGSPMTDQVDPSPSGLTAIEHRAKLFKLVRTLPADQKRVVQMRFAEEKSIQEIAQELRRSEGAVKQLQFRALQNLRDKMGGSK
ncbi:MAG TPA: RNA polymerase sigma factor [Candidatus Limnocylindrales bacterium]|nr:RNA polymerase sigma factor [Candidatus Limnocylindrales bacterium]